MTSTIAEAAEQADAVEPRALSLIREIYSAVVDEGGWDRFAGALSDAFGGAALLLWLPMPWPIPRLLSGDVLGGIVTYRVGLVSETPAEAAWKFANFPWPWTGAEFPNCFGRGRDFFSDAEVAATPFFQRAMQPQGLAAEGPIAAQITDSDGKEAMAIVAFRREGGRRFADEDIQLGNLLIPHLRRALDLDRANDAAATRTRALAEIVDRMANGVVLVDRTGRPVVTNLEADRILALEDGLVLESDRLRAVSARDDRALRSTIGDATAPDPPGVPGQGGVLGISRPSGRRDFAIVTVPLLPDPSGPGDRDLAAVVFVMDPESGQVSTLDVLRGVYSLTPAEAELARLVADGVNLERISEIRGVKIATTRSQLKQVFSKTGARSQSELVRLILHGVGAMNFDPGESPGRSDRNSKPNERAGS